jgi:hypothetical protein
MKNKELNFWPGAIDPDNCKRFCLYDALGYYKSYKTRRRAMQAIKDLGPTVAHGVWKLVDKWDNSVSYIGVENNEEDV